MTKLMDHFFINAANPVVVLTQDMARSFAGQSSEEKKFALFEEAMHFKDIAANFRQATAHVLAMQEARRLDAQRLEVRGWLWCGVDGRGCWGLGS